MKGWSSFGSWSTAHDIHVVQVDYQGRAAMSGVDSPTDVAHAEALIARHGELLAD